MKIRVENAYSDGHESELFYDIAEYDENACASSDAGHSWVDVPDGRYCEHCDSDKDELLREHLFEYTGDGHGIDSDLGSYHTVTIVDAADATLVGQVVEWG